MEGRVLDGNAGSQSWIELPDLRMHYRWDGEPDKPVLVLSNSLGANLTMWDAQVEAFSERYRVLRYDTRGHGQSSVPEGPYSIEALGRDVLALLDGLSVDRCGFCGLSMGGMIGQWLGIHAPGRIGKLVLANTAPKIGNAEGWNARIEAVLRDGVQALSQGILERWYTAEFRESHPETIAATRRMLDATDRAAYVACCAALRDMDQWESVSRIFVPTLVVAGTHDIVTPPEECRQLAAGIGGARYVELDAAHLSNVEAAEEFTSAVMDFLAL
jgi:3-oxoadipate enol-lactonase